MKTANKLISVLLSICLILACASGISAVDGTPNVTMTVSSTSVNVGDTVTVTVSCIEHTVAGFGFYLEFDKELLECTEIIGAYGEEDPEYYCLFYLNSRGREAEAEAQVRDSVDNTNSDGIYSFGWVPGSDTTIVEQTLITLNFTAKAAGTVNFVLNEQSSGTDAFKGVADNTKSVTINAPVSYPAVNLMGFNGDWSTGLSMTTTDGVTYTYTMELTSGTYEFKIKDDGTWLGNGGTIVDTTTATSATGWEFVDAGNCKLQASGGTYTFSFNAETNMLIITAELDESAHTHTWVDGKCESCGETKAVYLKGGFNNWGETDPMTWGEGGLYTITKELAGGDYEFKIVADGSWLTNTGTIIDTTDGETWELYDNSQNISLKATGGTYTFTYDINNNTLKVDAVLPHTHSYEDVVYTWNNYYTSCVVTGTCASTVGECTAPNLSADCSITASNADGVLTFTATYGEYSDSKTMESHATRAIYFYDTLKWANSGTINAYYWGEGNNPVSWPGVAATDLGNGLYVVIVPEGCDKIIFNNGSSQTQDLLWPTEGQNVAVPNGNWNDNKAEAKWGYNEPSKHTITFVVGAEGSYAEYEYYYGYNLTAAPMDTTRPSVECTSYTFTGWDKEFAPVTGDATYTAQYSSVTNHTPNEDDGDCTTAIYCTECGAETTAAKSHVDGDDKNHVCDNDGCNVDNVDGGHTPATDDGDCTTAIYCTECGAETTAAKSHVDGDDKNHACDNEGCTVDNVDGGHTPAADDGDCTTAIYCTECGAETTAAKSHVDGDDKNHVCDNEGCNVDNVDGGHTPAADDGDCTTAIYCTECGAETTAGKAHYDSADKNHDCDNCDVKNIEGHTAGDVVVEDEVAADCTTDGSYCNVVYCTECGEELSHDTITVPALGHTAGDVVVEDEVAAGCTTDGSYCNVVYCTECGEELSHDTVTVPAKGHSKTDVSYEDNGDGTHAVFCNVCGDVSVDNADCSYVDHKCQYCEALEQMTVIFMNGNEEWKSASCGYGEPLNFYGMPIPEIPEGHTWGGWYTTEGTKLMPGDIITENMVVYATWEKQSYTLTISYQGTVTKYELVYGAALPTIATDPIVTEDGKYTFWYWADMDAENIARVDELPETMPAKNLNYEAIFNYVGWLDWDGGRVFQAASGLLLTGWNCINDSNEIVTDGSGSWYYFDAETYYAATGITRVPYPTEAINGITYAPNADDKAYWESHKDTSSYTDAETAMFVFDENGKFVADTGIVEGNRYAVNGMIGWNVGLVEVDGDYYYFKGDVNGGGNIMATGNVYANRDYNSGLKTGNNVIYTFGTDGKLCKYTGINNVDGVLYYYNTDYSVAIGAGLVKVNDDYYYVCNDGKLVVGAEYWVANNNGYDVAVGMYEFDATGKLIIPETPEVLDGIVDIDGVLYYYKQGVKQSGAGVVQLTDENGETFYIYVKSNGQLATGIYWPTTLNGYLSRGAYNWGEDGRYYPSNPNVIVEIRNVNGTLYYYENGMKIPGKGVVKMTDENGETYYIYVRSNGALATGIYWPSTRNDLLDRGAYDWGTDGRYYPEG